MINYYLKFLTEKDAKFHLSKYIVDGEWMVASESHALDPVGAIDGLFYHVNLKLKEILPDNLKLFVIYPNTPSRVWA